MRIIINLQIPGSKINYAGMVSISDLVFKMTSDLANDPETKIQGGRS